MIPTAMLPHRITVARYLGATAYGPAYDEPRPMRARVAPKRRMVTTDTGATVVAEATILVRHGPIPAESKIVHHDRDYVVAAVTEAVGLGPGVHHYELLVTGPRPPGGA